MIRHRQRREPRYPQLMEGLDYHVVVRQGVRTIESFPLARPRIDGDPTRIPPWKDQPLDGAARTPTPASRQ